MSDFEGQNITQKIRDYGKLKKKNDDIVQAFRDIYLEKVADKIVSCCNNAVFRRCNECGAVHFVSTKVCKSRFCYVCSKKRYLATIARYYPILENYINEGHKLLMVTFTLKNMDDLSEMLERFNRTFKKFREKYNIYYSNVQGALVSREITNIGNGWHVHFHTILIMKKEYKMSDYEYQTKLIEAWKEKTIDSWSIKVSRIRGGNSGKGNLLASCCECFKYMTKLKMLDKSFLYELYTVTFKRRLISATGCMYGKVTEEQIEKDIEYKDLRKLENLICALCGNSATDSTVFGDSLDLCDTTKIYSFKSLKDK